VREGAARFSDFERPVALSLGTLAAVLEVRMGSDRRLTSWVRSLFTPPNAALLLFAVPQVWMYFAHQAASNHSQLSFLLLYAFFSLALFVSAALATREVSARVLRFTEAICPVAMAMLPAFQALSGYVAVGFLFDIACAVGGIGAALCFQLWFTRVCRAGGYDSAGYALLSFVIAAPVSACLSALSLLSGALACIVLIALTLTPAFALLLPWDADAAPSSSPRESPAADERQKRRVTIVAIETMVFSLALGTLQGMGPEASGGGWMTAASLLARMLVPLLLFVLVGCRPSRARLFEWSQALVVALAIVFVGLALLGGASGTVTAVLSSVARNALLVVLTLMLIVIVGTTGMPPALVYGVGRGIHAVGTMLGVLLSLRIELSVQPAIGTLDAAFFAVTVVFLFLALNSAKAISLLDMRSDAVEPDAEATGQDVLELSEKALDARCDEVAAQHGLTERECEVLKLLCRGRTRSYISECLGISPNTVRFHCKNVYRKCEVSSRQELLSLIGIE
jgi:DNA-binding CsgD family transcriptional regulator